MCESQNYHLTNSSFSRHKPAYHFHSRISSDLPRQSSSVTNSDSVSHMTLPYLKEKFIKVDNTFLFSVPLDILLKCTGKGKSLCISKLCIQIYLDFDPPVYVTFKINLHLRAIIWCRDYNEICPINRKFCGPVLRWEPKPSYVLSWDILLQVTQRCSAVWWSMKYCKMEIKSPLR
jgi:hypothetical protein